MLRVFRKGLTAPVREESWKVMRRKLIWIEEESFLGWGCSECAWVFNASGSPAGNSLDEMKRNYERRRDEEFAAHACTEHPEPRRQKAK
jgi:hypothetical protein